MSKDPLFDYEGKNIKVVWDERLCIHVGECGRAKGELFVAGRKPWCDPNIADNNEEVIEVIKRCPTGALSYQCSDGTTESQPDTKNKVTVCYNGPLYISGDLDIAAATDDMPSVKFRAALCRCGASKNKPFCDNQHEKIGFKDYGAVGEQGPGLEAEGDKLNISTIKDGPLMLKGNVTIVAASGREAWRGKQVALCRCGASKNKPFCDGAHKGIGFQAD